METPLELVEANRPEVEMAYFFRRLVAETIAGHCEDNYADPEVPPNDAFDLEQIFNALGLREAGDCQFMVFFTSRLREDAEEDLLMVADTHAHMEAAKQIKGGLNVYAQGRKVNIVRPDGEVLENFARSCCSWDSEWQAESAMEGKNHKFAVSITGKTYDWFDVALLWAFRTESGEIELVRTQDLNEEQALIAEAANYRARKIAAQRIAAQAALEESLAA